MGRSSGFGSTPSDWTPYSDSLSLRLPYSVKLATECKSLTHYTKVRRHPIKRLRLFVCIRFQVLFHSPHRGSFRLSSRYWFTIGRSRVFSLGGWSPIFRQDFTCPALLLLRLVPHSAFRLQGYHLLRPDFPFRSTMQNAKS